LSESSGRRVPDWILLIQMLLEHEERLKRMDGELRRIREYLTDLDALREQLSEWLRLTGRDEGAERPPEVWGRPAEGAESIRRLLEKLRRIERQAERDLRDNL